MARDDVTLTKEEYTYIYNRMLSMVVELGELYSTLGITLKLINPVIATMNEDIPGDPLVMQAVFGINQALLKLEKYKRL